MIINSKRMITAILIFCGTMSVFAQQITGESGKWTFIGQLTNEEDTLWAFPTDNLKEQNTVVRQDGAFRFTADLSQPREYYFLTPSLIRGEGGFGFVVTAVPGEVMKAEGFCDESKPADGLTFSGTPFYSYYTEADIAAHQVQEKSDATPAIDFVKAHPDCQSAATLVSAVACFAPGRLDEFLSLMSPTVRNGNMAAYIDKAIADAKEYLRQKELEGKTLPMGTEAPDFTLNDINGQTLSLSSLRGKIVVLDFWGSWCGWCIKGFPEMKTYYEKYKDKMEIVGMDCNDTDAKWKKAVADNALPWLHVYVPRGSSVVADYMVTAFPTKIIIDTDGKVLATIVGEDPMFYQLLDQMFQ